jgi:SAM-dependent methyltransferase
MSDPKASRLRARIRKHSAVKRLRRMLHPAWMGTLRRTVPLSTTEGRDRGQPVDRYYIESFLEQYRNDIRGRVLEVKDSTYTAMFGAGVTGSDVVDIDRGNGRATIIADLQDAKEICSATFDCFVMTQTLGLLADPRAAVAEAHRILRPGGTLLITVPGLGARSTDRSEAPADYWRFTADALRLLLDKSFGPGNVTVRSYGNVLSVVAGLMGMAAEELSRAELNVNDVRYPMVAVARAVKAPA